MLQFVKIAQLSMYFITAPLVGVTCFLILKKVDFQSHQYISCSGHLDPPDKGLRVTFYKLR